MSFQPELLHLEGPSGRLFDFKAEDPDYGNESSIVTTGDLLITAPAGGSVLEIQSYDVNITTDHSLNLTANAGEISAQATDHNINIHATGTGTTSIIGDADLILKTNSLNDLGIGIKNYQDTILYRLPFEEGGPNYVMKLGSDGVQAEWGPSAGGGNFSTPSNQALNMNFNQIYNARYLNLDDNAGSTMNFDPNFNNYGFARLNTVTNTEYSSNQSLRLKASANLQIGGGDNCCEFLIGDNRLFSMPPSVPNEGDIMIAGPNIQPYGTDLYWQSPQNLSGFAHNPATEQQNMNNNSIINATSIEFVDGGGTLAISPGVGGLARIVSNNSASLEAQSTILLKGYDIYVQPNGNFIVSNQAVSNFYAFPVPATITNDNSYMSFGTNGYSTFKPIPITSIYNTTLRTSSNSTLVNIFDTNFNLTLNVAYSFSYFIQYDSSVITNGITLNLDIPTAGNFYVVEYDIGFNTGTVNKSYQITINDASDVTGPNVTNNNTFYTVKITGMIIPSVSGSMVLGFHRGNGVTGNIKVYNAYANLTRMN